MNRYTRGVHRTPYGRYVARICVNYKHMHLGSFLTLEEAAKAYDAAVTKYRGPNRYLNFPNERATSA